MRAWVRLPLACLLGLAAVLGVPASPAHAAAYRYWTYWHAAPGSSSWGFAGSGPTYRPSPGAVEGWRFAVSQGTGSAPAPRTDPAKAYSQACGSRTPDSGQKLVALVLDYGTTSDAPPGEKPPGGVVATLHPGRQQRQRIRRPAGGQGVRAGEGRPDLRAQRLPTHRVRPGW